MTYTITVTNEVEAAIQKVATSRGLTAQEVIQNQLTYYIACALYEHMSPTLPFNTPGLDIPERAEAYAIYINSGETAAREYVHNILNPEQS